MHHFQIVSGLRLNTGIMIPLLFLLAFNIVAIKVFKKTSPNGKLTVYLGKRDFVDRCDGIVDPIDGVLLMDGNYLENRQVYGQVDTTFRYGREEDEMMGLKFSKTMVLVKEQIVPSKNKKLPMTPLQEKLLRKLGNTPNIYPFLFSLPAYAPPSVTLQPHSSDMGLPLGTEYELRAFIAENEQDPGHKRSTVSLRIRKVQFASIERGKKQPSSLITKGFTFSPGKISIEVSLDRDVYYHGEDIGVHVFVTNTCKKSVKNIKVMVVQHCEVTMVNAQFSRTVAHMESREGCPITPGASLTKVFRLNPSAANNKDKRGIALDGNLKDEDVNLASSTLMSGHSTDAIGFVVSYSVRVKVNCGTLGGEVTADLPFKLVHPDHQLPGDQDEDVQPQNLGRKLKKGKSGERANYESLCYGKDENDDEGNIIFEDFAKLRMSMSEIDK